MIFEGVVSPSELRDSIKQFFFALEKGECVNALADLSGVTSWDVGVVDLRATVAIAAKHLERLAGMRSAIVANTAEAFGMSRMFELTLGPRVGLEVQVFQIRAEAEEWLRLSKR